MADMGDFRVGERVAHITNGDGVVVVSDDEDVRVKYDNGSLGIYDDVWFYHHPKFLFHRSPAPTSPRDGVK